MLTDRKLIKPEGGLCRVAARHPPDATAERMLLQAIPLFARSGFDGVSMREVAAVVGVTPAALYYHFTDKEDLYLALVGHAFNSGVRDVFGDISPSADPWTRLEVFVIQFIHLLAREQDLQRLMQWVLLDTDQARSQRLADGVFKPFYQSVSRLLHDICQVDDIHPLLGSVFGLLVFPFESAQVSRFMPGFNSPHSHPQLVADHVMSLLRYGLLAPSTGTIRP